MYRAYTSENLDLYFFRDFISNGGVTTLRFSVNGFSLWRLVLAEEVPEATAVRHTHARQHADLQQPAAAAARRPRVLPHHQPMSEVCEGDLSTT
jgi:hypothetical protein